MKGLIIAIVVVAALAFLAIRAWNKMKNTPVAEDSHLIEQLTEQNFNNKIKKGMVLVDFWADWCMPCKMMAPVLNEVAEATEGKASVYKLNVDEYQQVAAKYGIRNIPTMILFKDGKEVERLVGMKSKESLITSIEKAKK
jgi:thioredoxin 1